MLDALNDRPILQRSLVGAGAFMFVFTAAMAGSAFMISGGFGFGGGGGAIAETPTPHYAVVTQQAWDNWSDAGAQVSPTSYTPPAEQLDAPRADAPSYSSLEGLDGEARGEQVHPVEVQSEDDIIGEIAQEFAGDYESYNPYEPEASTAPVEAEPAYVDDPKKPSADY